MANYVTTNGSTGSAGTQQNCASAYTQTTLGVTCSSANGTANTTFRRGKVYDVLVGTNGTPGDTFVEWDISRCTTSSTATFVTGQALDPADQTTHLTLAVVNSSQHGTISVQNLWYVGMNQRASYRWVCAPGSELVWPTTTSNGLVLRPRGSYTSTVTATWMWQEQ